MHEVAPVDEWDNLYPGRQDTFVQFFDFSLQPFERRLRFRAFAHGHPRGHNIVVIDDFSVFVTNGAGELAKPDLRTLCDFSDILDAKRRAALGHNHCVFDIVYVADYPDLYDINLL